MAAIRARGYTPITRSLQLAAEDIGGEPVSERTVVLVSDGRETCKATHARQQKPWPPPTPSLSIHTIELGGG